MRVIKMGKEMKDLLKESRWTTIAGLWLLTVTGLGYALACKLKSAAVRNQQLQSNQRV